MKILKKIKIRLEIRKREKILEMCNGYWKDIHNNLDIVGSERFLHSHSTMEVRQLLFEFKLMGDRLFETQTQTIAELYKLDKELKNV